MTSLIEMLAGAPSPGPMIEAAKLGAHFWKGPPETRLLTLLHHDFGERAGLSRDRFRAWQTDEGLMDALAPVLSGAAVPDEQTAAKLAELIAMKLTETDPADRPALALEIAQGVLLAPASVLRTEEKTSYLVEGSQRDGRRLAEVQETVERTHDGISRVLRSLGAGTDDVVVRALITDPIRHAGVEGSAELAAQYSDGGRHGDAAVQLLTVAEALRSRGLAELAEVFAIRAAESLTSAGRLFRAREMLIEAVWARLGDLLRVDHVGVRRAAVVLWRHIHPEAPIASPEREQLLADPHPALRALLAEIAAARAVTVGNSAAAGFLSSWSSRPTSWPKGVSNDSRRRRSAGPAATMAA